VGITGSTEDLVLVIAQHLEPVPNIGGMPLGVVWNAALCHQKDTRKLRPKFFLA